MLLCYLFEAVQRVRGFLLRKFAALTIGYALCDLSEAARSTGRFR